MLTGNALLEKVRENSSLPKREKAIACGYGEGSRVQMSKFLQALLEAEGVLGDRRSSRKGREASFKVSVQKNGAICIGAAYTEMMGLLPGEWFEIKLGYKHIHLIKVENLDSSEDGIG